MRDVTTETVRERMNELGQRITTGRISLREEFELSCLRELLTLMNSRTVTVKLPTELELRCGEVCSECAGAVTCSPLINTPRC